MHHFSFFYLVYKLDAPLYCTVHYLFCVDWKSWIAVWKATLQISLHTAPWLWRRKWTETQLSASSWKHLEFLVHTFYHRQRVEESPSKLPPMTGSSKPLRWNSFFRCLSLQTQPLSLNLELPCTFLTQRGVSSFSAFGSSFLMNIMIFLGDIPVYLVMVTVFCDLLISHESNSAARKEKGTINGQCYKNKNLKK